MSRIQRKYRVVRHLARTLLLVLAWEVLAPLTAEALTSGPTQPEVMGFTPAGTSGLVDPFTGDFQYSIPLFELPGPNGGYPFTLGYRSGITMDQEASWVGLGWNLSPGAITRQMRGLPDEFDGDTVVVHQDMKPDVTVGVSGAPVLELFGFETLEELKKLSGSFSFDLSFYYNNYRGFGYSLAPNFSIGSANKEHSNLSVGLGFNLDSQEGVGFQPSLSLRSQFENINGGVGTKRNLTLAASFHSRAGLSSLGLSGRFAGTIRNKEGKSLGTGFLTESATFSFFQDGYIPMASPKMAQNSGSLRVQPGFGANGAFLGTSFTAFHHESRIEQKLRFLKAYGFNNLEKRSAQDLADFNRYEDGQLFKETTNLATPVLTADLYQISASGIGGQFRSWRNDVGVVFDPFNSAEKETGVFGTDFGGLHNGADIAIHMGNSASGPWNESNNTGAPAFGYGFQAETAKAADYEPWYFKMQGEMVSDPINDLEYSSYEEPVRVALLKAIDEERVLGIAASTLEDQRGNATGQSTQNSYATDSSRRARNTVIEEITNGDLASGPAPLPEFLVEYYNVDDPIQFSPHSAAKVAYDRSSHPDHHFAGLVAHSPNGMKYNFALPAYNSKHIENAFSVNGGGMECGQRIDVEEESGLPKYDFDFTNQFLSRKVLPQYAHSFFMTSIEGNDYVDADSISGPSDGDLGYWVKFDYVRTTDSMRWRTPFVGANLNLGRLSEIEDDQGSYLYGEKENWYVSSAETKTHIAEFHISQRKDNHGALSEFQNEGDPNILGKASYRLDSISLYSKAERFDAAGAVDTSAVPIQVVHFEYSYDLCGNVWNNELADPLSTTVAESSGKLTLERIWFTGEESKRGEIHPISFTYGNNPSYHPLRQDRWGTFKDTTTICEQFNYPYTDNRRSRSELDSAATAWNLTRIILPTGGEIEISYEADDYAYVQDQKAMRMFEITRMGEFTNNQVFDGDYSKTDPVKRRVYFELDEDAFTKADVEPYVKGMDQIYMRVKMKTRSPQDIIEEFVPAYYEIEDYGIDNPGVANSKAYIVLKPSDANRGKWKDFHPVALAGWNHLRSSSPRLVSVPPNPLASSSLANSGQVGNNKSKIIQQARSLLNSAPDLALLFGRYYQQANNNLWGSRFDPANSWIRLQDPDHSKVGGGSRVKQVRFLDNWDQGTATRYSNITGIAYSYTTTENNRTISSGVASYEPIVGGDENPLARAKSFTTSTLLRSPLNLFFEYPINEAYMPAPGIGYSKVTMKSLNTERIINDPSFGVEVPSSGITISEFFTAKDFPVITGETEIDKIPFQVSIPIPFIGSLSVNDLTASQGYLAILNDMHGKPRKTSSYGLLNDGTIDPNPISWIEYDYQDGVNPGGAGTRRLTNKVEVLLGDVDPQDYRNSHFDKRTLGQDHEYFVDMRESYDNMTGGGVDINFDQVLFLPTFFPWPSFNSHRSRVRTAVTNKIIYRHGILKGTRAYNQGSLIETEHLLYDAQTGRALLSKVTNNYDEPVYSYQYPAFWAYDQMGPAYRNIGLEFSATAITAAGSAYFTLDGVSVADRQFELLVPGDELLVRPLGSANTYPAWYVGDDASGKPQLYCEGAISNASGGTMKIIRSGRRNLLGVNATEITALKDPTRGRDTVACWQDLASPNSVIDSMWVEIDTLRDTLPAPCVENWFGLVNGFLNVNPATYGNSGSSYPGQGDYCFSCSDLSLSQLDSLTMSTECGCLFKFTDDQGNPLSLNQMQSFKTPVYTASAPFTAPAGYTFTQMTGTTVYNNTATTVYIFTDNASDCGLPYSTTEQIVKNYLSTLTVTPTATMRADTMFMLDSVLSASAATFSDAWIQSYEDVRYESGNAASQLSALEARDPFAKGQQGVWRGKSGFVYVTDRRQSPDINTRKDGTFDGLAMFNFQNPIFEKCAANWRQGGEITRYSPYSYELENRDILGVYSAALYGYNGKLPTAVAANASYREIGFESFEEYEENEWRDVLGLTTGNLDFPTSTSATAPPFYRYQDIDMVNQTSLFYTGPLASPVTNTTPIFADGRSFGSYFDPAVNGVDEIRLNPGNPLTYSGSDRLYLHGDTTDAPWVGRIAIEKEPLAGITPAGTWSYTDDKAHTGKMSLKFSGNPEFIQNRLHLDTNTTYTVQAWVSRDDVDVPFFQMNAPFEKFRLGVQVHYYDENGTALGASDLLEPSGRLVEGWQKIEGDISPPDGTWYVSIELQSGRTKTSLYEAYVDDIRLQPKVSQMTCHVYDPQDYRLRASLDDNNFALIYHYDESGNLYLTQKETTEGLRTITESRGFLTEQ